MQKKMLEASSQTWLLVTIEINTVTLYNWVPLVDS